MPMDTDKAAATANARAYLRLRRAVLAGHFKSGEFVTLRAITELLGLGEMAAREALKRLISEGAFEALPNRSARVPILGRRELEQLAELRSLLESDAAALAAANVTLREIEALQVVQDQMVEAVAQGDVGRYRDLHLGFHFEVYRLADNKPLANLIEALWLRMAPFISHTIGWVSQQRGHFELIATSRHQDLLDAFLKRDREAARAAMQDDLGEIRKLDGYWDGVGD